MNIKYPDENNQSRRTKVSKINDVSANMQYEREHAIHNNSIEKNY